MSNLLEDSFDTDEEYEDTEGLLRKALDVDFPGNFNPNSVPRDGMEYLHHVMYERNKCKKLVISDIDPSKFRTNQTLTLPLKKLTCETSVRLLPSLEWQVKKLIDFKYFKHIVETQNKSKSEPTISTFNEDEFIMKYKKIAPEYSSLRQYTQPAKIRMLELMTQYILNKKLLDDPVGTWIFGILVTLDIPLSPSSCHVVREFIRSCQHVRSNFSEAMEERDCTAFNFYICICSRYFGQLDLAD